MCESLSRVVACRCTLSADKNGECCTIVNNCVKIRPILLNLYEQNLTILSNVYFMKNLV